MAKINEQLLSFLVPCDRVSRVGHRNAMKYKHYDMLLSQ